MNEKQLNDILGTMSDPIKNRYRLDTRKQVNEVQRLMRIFAINEEQKIKHKLLSIKNLATMKLVYSYN